MKKNVMMRIASFLMVAVLLSTCAISGTFAKYVSTDYTQDSARVAKWGVTITGKKGTENTMFSDSYKDTPATYTANEDLATITVQADTQNTNVVAPGTNSTLSAFAITGTPEVDVTVTYVADLTLTGWQVDGDFYCPIVFNVNGTEIKQDATNNTAALLEAAVEAEIEAASATYHTNTDLSAVNDDLTVTWSWAFEVDDATNAKDTKLGNEAVTGSASNIALKVDVIIAQVD